MIKRGPATGHRRALRSALDLRACGTFLFVVTLTGCKKPATSDSPDAAVPVPSAAVAAITASASVAPPIAQAPPKKLVVTTAPANVECRAKNEGGLIELSLTWDRNTAKGMLTADGKAHPVIAELYKGLVLVDAPGTSPVTGKIATMTTEGKKTIRIGDYKQPSFDCN